MARTASPGILMLALLLTATTTQARKPASPRPHALPQPATSAEHAPALTPAEDSKLSCL